LSGEFSEKSIILNENVLRMSEVCPTFEKHKRWMLTAMEID
jgi:hypothetical protein